ncbi:ABC transporter permease [Pseudomonas knackmussii]|uniref:ABC transporter permease n=1 Tax=Pseudomonas knackmussii TaxID=65741 RepID=UPI003F4A38B1
MISQAISISLRDISASTKRLPLAGLLGWQDVKQRYRRSTLGPFWLTISMGVMIATIGIVFGQIFNSPMKEFLPFLTAGMILWTYFSSVATESCTAFVYSEHIIRQLPLPYFIYIIRVIWRNILILGHNLLILPLVFLAVGKPISIYALLSIPGLLLATINLTWVALLFGVICTRFRDLSQIIGSLLQILFYITPIMWLPNLLPQRAGPYVLATNPIFHIIETIRSPLLGQLPTATNWIVSASMAIAGWCIALLFYGRYKRRIPYWL